MLYVQESVFSTGPFDINAQYFQFLRGSPVVTTIWHCIFFCYNTNSVIERLFIHEAEIVYSCAEFDGAGSLRDGDAMEDPCIECDNIAKRNAFLKKYQDRLFGILKDSKGKPLFKQTKDGLRKQAENALKASEQRFKRLSETAFGAIAVHQDGKIIDVNQKHIEMFGYTLEELSNINGIEMIAPEWRETVTNHVASNHEEPYEVMAIGKDETIFPAEIQAKVSQMNGHTIRIEAIKDLTKQKEVERQIAKSEKKYRELYNNSPIAMYRTKIIYGKLLECNQALIRLFGYDSKEDFQAAINMKSIFVDMNDRKVLLEKLKKDKRAEGFQFQVKRKDGECRWVEATAEIFPEQGFVEGSIKDITASKLLTKKEKQVLQMIMKGKSNKEVAYILKRSTRTIEDHRSHLMNKLGANNLVELIQQAQSLQLEP